MTPDRMPTPKHIVNEATAIYAETQSRMLVIDDEVEVAQAEVASRVGEQQRQWEYLTDVLTLYHTYNVPRYIDVDAFVSDPSSDEVSSMRTSIGKAIDVPEEIRLAVAEALDDQSRLNRQTASARGTLERLTEEREALVTREKVALRLAES